MLLGGLQVEVARDGRRGSAPSLILCDLGLPGVDGWARAIRAAGTTAPYLVALSGHGRAVDRARSSAAGFDAHLTMPLEMHRLLEVFEMARRHQRGS